MMLLYYSVFKLSDIIGSIYWILLFGKAFVMKALGHKAERALISALGADLVELTIQKQSPFC